jgi:organic radical activating enzyme
MVNDMSDKDQYKTYDYGSRAPTNISLNDLTKEEKFLLTESDYFCILPWIHMHGWPTGEALLCCMSNDPIGNLRTNTMQDIWNNEPIKEVRRNMLNEKSCKQCNRCYNDEKHGLFSMRNSSNKHFGHYIKEVEKTLPDGTNLDFKIRYWDIRFSNICNFKCRYCGPTFSSNWWEDKAALYGAENIKYQKFIHAGKDKEDIWNQMQAHLPYIEQIYFAGGEPLLMEEHYRLLNYLIDNNRTDVKIIYNTNFSELTFKKQNVLDLWKKFDSVSVGASLDAMGPRAEYMRKGTVWFEIEDNRKQMIEICPKVDFYISATVNIFNILHITDFHKDWIEKGFIAPQDFNINVLHEPSYYRCDILPQEYKQVAYDKINTMIEWLEPKDTLTRATNGYKGLSNFLMANDNSRLLKDFFKITRELDVVRKEKFEDVFPEFERLNGAI